MSGVSRCTSVISVSSISPVVKNDEKAEEPKEKNEAGRPPS